jgi:outer membrane protein assembly factor BamA
MMTEQLDVTGYQNYCDRYDVNGGPDFGYKINSQLAATLGYRYGYQYQQQFSFSPYSSSSDYQRVLLGLEGKPWHWLEVKLQGGPDFRNYQGDSPGHITPVNNLNLITYYGEATLVATLTSKDAVTFKYKQWQWVSSCGKVPYFDSSYDLSYHRRLTDKLGFDLGGRLIEADYTSGNLAASKRDDLQYTVSTGLGYAFNTHASVNLTYAANFGRNAQNGITNPQTRDYDEQLISLAALFKF